MNQAEVEISEENRYLMGLGMRLRHYRKARKLSMAEVRLATGGMITQAALGSYERGTRQISVLRLTKLAELYQVPSAFLLDEPALSPISSRYPQLPQDHPAIVVLSAAVLQCTNSEAAPLQRLLRSLDPAQLRRSFTITDEQLRHLAVVYGKPKLETVRMFRSWGLIQCPK